MIRESTASTTSLASKPCHAISSSSMGFRGEGDVNWIVFAFHRVVLEGVFAMWTYIPTFKWLELYSFGNDLDSWMASYSSPLSHLGIRGEVEGEDHLAGPAAGVKRVLQAKGKANGGLQKTNTRRQRAVPVGTAEPEVEAGTPRQLKAAATHAAPIVTSSRRIDLPLAALVVSDPPTPDALGGNKVVPRSHYLAISYFTDFESEYGNYGSPE